MSAVHVAPRRLVLAAALALAMGVSPATATAIADAATYPQPCKVDRAAASAFLDCAPHIPATNGAPSEMNLTMGGPGLATPSLPAGR
jgi:hypothetical protein